MATSATYRAVLRRNLLTIGLLTVASGIGLFLLSGILVDVLLGGGKFGPDDVALTASVVAAFAISIPFDALAYPLSRGLYATHDTIRQVISSFAGLGVVIVVSQALVGPLGILAIPLSYAAGHGGQGRAARDVPRRSRPADRAARGYGALRVGTTEM